MAGVFTGDPYAVEPLSLWDVIPPNKFFDKCVEHSGSVGIGILAERLPLVAYSVPYFAFWMVCRKVSHQFLFPALARAGGLNKKSTQKFCYQMWLLTYYTVSASLAFWGFSDEPWFKFPLDHKAAVDTFYPAYLWPTPFLEFIYQFQLGFYFAELVAIFIEPKRSDFWEYVFHHSITIFLVAFSSLSLEMRIGAYVFFIHDVPDIFLCLSKALHYLKYEKVVNCVFVCFVTAFVFGRLVCLPSLTYRLLTVSPLMHTGSHIYTSLTAVLSFALQGLHIFWLFLIIRMVLRLLRGGSGDVRSDEDDDQAPTGADKSKKNKSRRQ